MQWRSPVSECPSHHFKMFLPLEGLPFGSSSHHYLISWGCHSPSLKTGLAEMDISLKTVWCPKETLPNNENKKGGMIERTGSIKTDFENDILYLFLLFYLKWLLAQKGHFKSHVLYVLFPFSCVRLSPPYPNLSPRHPWPFRENYLLPLQHSL